MSGTGLHSSIDVNDFVQTFREGERAVVATLANAKGEYALSLTAEYARLSAEKVNRAKREIGGMRLSHARALESNDQSESDEITASASASASVHVWSGEALIEIANKKAQLRAQKEADQQKKKLERIKKAEERTQKAEQRKNEQENRKLKAQEKRDAKANQRLKS